MTKDRLLKLLKAKADNTKACAESFAHKSGFKRPLDIPLDDATFSACLNHEWCCIGSIIHMLEDESFFEEICKIYLSEDETK